MLEFYLVGELTHMRSMCVGVAETGVEHCSPAKNHKETFSLSYFCMTKSTIKKKVTFKIKSKNQILYRLTAENFMP